MKIKIVCYNNTEELETQINEFIADKIVHDIKFQSVGFYDRWNGNGIPTSGITNDRVIIMYDDKEANRLDTRIKKEAQFGNKFRKQEKKKIYD